MHKLGKYNEKQKWNSATWMRQEDAVNPQYIIFRQGSFSFVWNYKQVRIFYCGLTFMSVSRDTQIWQKNYCMHCHIKPQINQPILL